MGAIAVVVRCIEGAGHQHRHRGSRPQPFHQACQVSSTLSWQRQAGVRHRAEAREIVPAALLERCLRASCRKLGLKVRKGEVHNRRYRRLWLSNQAEKPGSSAEACMHSVTCKNKQQLYKATLLCCHCLMQLQPSQLECTLIHSLTHGLFVRSFIGS